MTESHLRSVAKGISWRVIGTIDTMVISYLVTGSVKYAAVIGSVEAITKVVLFWGHERVWHQVSWGRKHYRHSRS
jgi:uncharacterized membrane protein